MDFTTLQAEQREWAQRNFGDADSVFALLGVFEEVGELAHSHLKGIQGIRMSEDHEAKAKDAIADVIIFLTDYTTRRGWDLNELVETAWNEVKQRNWKADPVTGADAQPAPTSGEAGE